MDNFHVTQYFIDLKNKASSNGKEFYAKSMAACASREAGDAAFFRVHGALELPEEISF